MPKVQVCVGTVAAGKSTFAKKRAREGALVLNDDNIVNALHGNNYSLYEKELKPVYKGIGYAILSYGILAGRDVVVDRLNIKKSTRKRYITAVESMDAEVEAVIFPMVHPKQHARWRVASNARGASYEKWLEVAEEKFDKYTPVSDDEGFDSIIHIHFIDILKMVQNEQNS